MPTDFTSRPLRDTAADRRRFVDRRQDLTTLRRALELHFNVLLLGDPGIGATTLLIRLAASLPDAVRLNAEACGSAAEVLALAVEARGGPAAETQAEAGSRAALGELAGRVTRESTLIVDGLASAIAFELFGRMRDDLWQLDACWILAARTADAPVVTTPPADAFFGATHVLGPLGEDDVVALLARRDPDALLDDATRRRIARRSGGHPGEALRLARVVALSGPEAAFADDGAPALVDRVRAELGEPAARLVRELANNGPVGPSDAALRRRMGWSQPRLYEVFRQLEQGGYLARGAERNGRVGRPRSVYALTDGGPR